MCTNYAAARRDRIFKQFGVEPPDSPRRDDVYKDYPAPIVRRLADAEGADVATFGMVPHKHIPLGVRVFDTMNARGNGGREAQLQRRMEAAAVVPYPVRGIL